METTMAHEQKLHIWDSSKPIRVAISACLLGHQVRYDGGHKHDPFLTETLGQYVEWVPVCPEVEIGLGVPRPTLRLERRDDEICLIMPAENRDLTDTMKAFAQRRLRELVDLEICGYVLKKNSPSCGMERVKLYKPDGHPVGKDRGVFAAKLLEMLPYLPVEEEGRLHDPRLRENWVTRIFAFQRLKNLWSQRWSMKDLVAFHTAHKYLLLAHSPGHYKKLGQLVAKGKSLSREELKTRYEADFMGGLKRLATTAKNANVLHHMLGFFKKLLPEDVRAEILQTIKDYRKGSLPLVVPITLIAHYARRMDVTYLLDQVYLYPHPKELGLRNHV
ncbi:MAG: YbgA family protein [Thermogutta sp.]